MMRAPHATFAGLRRDSQEADIWPMESIQKALTVGTFGLRVQHVGVKGVKDQRLEADLLVGFLDS